MQFSHGHPGWPAGTVIADTAMDLVGPHVLKICPRGARGEVILRQLGILPG